MFYNSLCLAGLVLLVIILVGIIVITGGSALQGLPKKVRLFT